MEEKLRSAIGIPKDVLVNKELGLIMEEHRQKRKDKADIADPSNPHFICSRWRQHWPSIKPFLNGGAIGVLAGSWASLYYSKSCMYAQCRQIPMLHGYTKILPGAIYIHVLTVSQQLGLYEILRNKAIATNKGMPPTLCQEAACGLAVGATGALINFPLYSGYLGYNCHQSTERFPIYRYVFSFVRTMATQRTLFREMWNYVGPFLKRKMWLDMGMLASYNPSLDYLRESCGFSEAKAQLGASALSAFFAAACSLPSKHIRIVRQETGYASSLDCALAILKSRGPLGFFTGLPTCFSRVALPIMTTWFVLERIRNLEISIGL
ncbi:unnamed protein product [Malus baccata var. baccata]